jgi:hypothetical protein
MGETLVRGYLEAMVPAYQSFEGGPSTAYRSFGSVPAGHTIHDQTSVLEHFASLSVFASICKHTALHSASSLNLPITRQFSVGGLGIAVGRNGAEGAIDVGEEVDVGAADGDGKVDTTPVQTLHVHFPPLAISQFAVVSSSLAKLLHCFSQPCLLTYWPVDVQPDDSVGSTIVNIVTVVVGTTSIGTSVVALIVVVW